MIRSINHRGVSEPTGRTLSIFASRTLHLSTMSSADVGHRPVRADLRPCAPAANAEYHGIMTTRRTLLGIGVLLVAPFAVWADDSQMTRLTIEVKNLDGKPVDRASVVVKFIKGRSKAKFGRKVIKSWNVRTNQMGVVSVPPIPQGDIRVQVIARGYQTFGETYDIEEPEKTIEVTLNPPQPQYSVHQ